MDERVPPTEPRSDEQPDARFWNRMAKRYAASAIADEGAYGSGRPRAARAPREDRPTGRHRVGCPVALHGR